MKPRERLLWIAVMLPILWAAAYFIRAIIQNEM